MNTARLLGAIVIPALALATTLHAAEAAFPDKPIRLIVGSASGSGPDIVKASGITISK